MRFRVAARLTAAGALALTLSSWCPAALALNLPAAQSGMADRELCFEHVAEFVTGKPEKPVGAVRLRELLDENLYEATLFLGSIGSLPRAGLAT